MCTVDLSSHFRCKFSFQAIRKRNKLLNLTIEWSVETHSNCPTPRDNDKSRDKLSPVDEWEVPMTPGIENIYSHCGINSFSHIHYLRYDECEYVGSYLNILQKQ